MVNRRLLLFGGASALWGAPPTRATVLYGDREVELATSRVESGDLWIPFGELPRINEFSVKPQGACRADICIPLSKDLKRKGWLNLSGFARKMKQPVVNDGTLWSFGEIPTLRGGFLESRLAPDFAVKDRKGNIVRLTDFRGRKILLLTWASW